VNDLVNSARRDADILRELILADPQGIQKFLEEDLSGMNGRQLPRHCGTS
jgi:hypothetical protein